MSSVSECCNPCTTVQTVNIPGPEGGAGTNGLNGADGINAYTITTANFDVPALGVNVTVEVVNSSWMVAGQPVFIAGAGFFTVVSKPTTTSAILTYSNVPANTSTGTTINAGAGVSPSGNALTVLPALTNYNVAGSQALTVTPAQILAAQVTLAIGNYLLLCTARFDLDVATFPANQVLTVKVRRTNNTPGDIPSAVASFQIPVSTLQSHTLGVIPLPAVTYTAGAGDILQLFADVDGLPYSGSVIAVETSMLAIQLF